MSISHSLVCIAGVVGTLAFGAATWVLGASVLTLGFPAVVTVQAVLAMAMTTVGIFLVYYTVRHPR